MSNTILMLGSIGLTLIIKYGFILNFPREFVKNKAKNFNKTLGIYVDKFFSCCQCIGFWSGLIIYFLFTYNILNSFIFALASSFLCNFIDMIMDYIAEVTFKTNLENDSKIKKD